MKGRLYLLYKKYLKPLIPRRVLQGVVGFFEQRTHVMRRVEDAQRQSSALSVQKKHGTREYNWIIPSPQINLNTIPDDTHVSIIIPTKDSIEFLEQCVHSVYAHPQYLKFDVTIINNRSSYPKRIAKIAGSYDNCRVVEYDHPFHFARMNNVVARNTTGTHLLFLNDDVEVKNSQWLSAMMETINSEGVGIVGAKLLFPDDIIQHAGFYMTTPEKGVVEYWHKGVPAYREDGTEEPGYQNSLIALRDVSAVTAACLLISRHLWNELDGFDEELRIGFNDIDLCLRAEQKGYTVMVDPRAVLYHHESISRKAEKNPHILHHAEDSARFIKKWSELLDKPDPHIDPKLLG